MRPCVRRLAILLLVAVPGLLPAQQKTRFATLDDALRASTILSGRTGPRNVNWIEGGARFSYITADPRTGREVIRAVDPATGQDTLLFSAEGLTYPDTAAPFAYESFQWARDSRHLVFQTRFEQLYRNSGTATFYVYSLADRQLQLAARGARTAELSPDGSMLGFERGGNMYVRSTGSDGPERQLTRGASEHVYTGHFDWVYEEEFGMTQAWSWSPDSHRIAYWQTDERPEPVVQLTDYAGRHPSWDRLRIPQPGDSNAVVRLGIVDVRSGRNVWLDPGVAGEYYIPRIYWTSRADTLAVVVLDRPQKDLKLFFFDVRTGGKRLVLHETSKTWIDVYDFYAGIQDMFTFPAGMHEFFWISDRDGWQHLYRYDYSGRLLGQVTRGAWSVTRVEGIDPRTQTVYYTSTQASPLQRQLYSVRFDGTGEHRITTEPGTHRIDMSPDTRFFIDRWSSLRQPVQVDVWATQRGPLRKMEENAETMQWLSTHAYSTPQLFNFTTSDGVKLDGFLIPPVPFDSTRRYPVVFSVYGGPGSQEVYDEFNGSGWLQWLAQEGYIVVGLNNRGSNNYGSAFMKVVYGQLGKYESHDFAEAARYLARLPYVNGRRIAIMGTSYGGYSTVYTMEMYPDVFSAGVANSAVADWRLYDTIYTERYMGLLGENESGYDRSSAVANAAKLGGHLLLIHSMMDDNVHPQNTMQLLTALTEAGKDVSLRIYPPGHHGAAYDYASYRLIQQVSDAFLARRLSGGADSTASSMR